MLQMRGPKRLRFSLKSPPRFEVLRRFPFGSIEPSTGASGAISSTLGMHRFCVTFVTVGFRLVAFCGLWPSNDSFNWDRSEAQPVLI